jgi:hypothetical protein
MGSACSRAGSWGRARGAWPSIRAFRVIAKGCRSIGSSAPVPFRRVGRRPSGEQRKVGRPRASASASRCRSRRPGRAAAQPHDDRPRRPRRPARGGPPPTGRPDPPRPRSRSGRRMRPPPLVLLAAGGGGFRIGERYYYTKCGHIRDRPLTERRVCRAYSGPIAGSRESRAACRPIAPERSRVWRARESRRPSPSAWRPWRGLLLLSRTTGRHRTVAADFSMVKL